MLKIIAYLNKAPVWIAVLLLLCLNFLGLNMHSNEEMYLALAKQFYQPDFLPNSFNLTQFPSNRILYQYIAGYMLDYLSFEHTALLGRAVLCFLIAFPIAKIIKIFDLSLIEGLFLLQVFFFSNQAFFSESWIFLSFESKCISYVFVFWAMFCLLNNQLNISIILLAIATWFHVLVGGWTFLIVFIYMIFKRSTLKQLFSRGLIYTILVAPMIWYLSQEILLNTTSVINGIHIDWIYTQYRNPHHTSPFLKFENFAEGIMFLIAWGIISFSFFTKLEQPVLKRINVFNLVTIGFLLLSLGVAWFDEHGVFTKFYPFRPNTLLKFFIIFEMAMVLKLWILKADFSPYINASLLIFLIPFLSSPVYSLVQSYDQPSKNAMLWDDFTRHIQQNTPKDAVFLIYTGSKDHHGDGYLSFHRKTQRDCLVQHKFVPSGGNQIYDWYVRTQEKNKLAGHLEYLTELNKKYRLDYLISNWRLSEDNLDLKYHNDRHFLYKIKK